MSLLDNLVSWWKLDEASGQRNDSHGTNHLTDVNTVTQIAGKVGNAAQFTAGNSENLTVADNASFAFTTAFSLCFWIRMPTLATNHCFAGKWTFQTDGGWAIQSGNTASTSITAYIATSAADASTGCRMGYNNVLVADTWHHVAMVYDGTLTGNANRLKVYVDGVSKAQTVVLGAVPASLQSDGAALNFGRWGGALTRYLTGYMDEVGLWSRALTSAEVTFLHNSGNGVTYEGLIPPATGTMAVTEAADTAALAGDVLVEGDLAATEAADTAALAGEVLVEGQLAATESADVCAAVAVHAYKVVAHPGDRYRARLTGSRNSTVLPGSGNSTSFRE